MTKEELRAAMPKVGDRLVKKPHLHKSLGIENPRPMACVVDFVNEDKLWYRVRFENGTRECFKLPEIDEKNRGGWAKR